jgi:hypothetical protein
MTAEAYCAAVVTAGTILPVSSAVRSQDQRYVVVRSRGDRIERARLEDLPSITGDVAHSLLEWSQRRCDARKRIGLGCAHASNDVSRGVAADPADHGQEIRLRLGEGRLVDAAALDERCAEQPLGER